MGLGRRPQTVLRTTASSVDGEPLIRLPDGVLLEAEYIVQRLDLQHKEFPRSIAVTSYLSGEGVTVISQSLISILSTSRDVCLLDANWQNPSFAPRQSSVGGLEAILAGRATLDEVIVNTNCPTLSIIPAGTVDFAEQVELIDPDLTLQLLQTLARQFEVVVLDLPAVTTSAATLSMADAAESAMLVARQGVTDLGQVDAAFKELKHAQFLGVVLNANRMATPGIIRKFQKVRK